MAFQPKVVSESPYVDFEAMEATRPQDAQNRFSLELKDFRKTLGYATYILFFAWQVIGLVLYSIREFEATIHAKQTSYQVAVIEAFNHSEELQLVWVISQTINAGLVLMALSKVPSFIGYSAIFSLLVRLPSFWSLLCLYLISALRYILIIWLHYRSGHVALLFAFMIWEGSQVILIGFLNFTQVNHIRKKYPFTALVLFKFNILLSFLSVFVNFVVNSLQFALQIYGIDKNSGISSDLLPIIGAIRKLTSAVFLYRIYIFYWEKLFLDHRNILCHYDYLYQFP